MFETIGFILTFATVHSPSCEQVVKSLMCVQQQFSLQSVQQGHMGQRCCTRRRTTIHWWSWRRSTCTTWQLLSASWLWMRSVAASIQPSTLIIFLHPVFLPPSLFGGGPSMTVVWFFFYRQFEIELKKSLGIKFYWLPWQSYCTFSITSWYSASKPCHAQQ